MKRLLILAAALTAAFGPADAAPTTKPQRAEAYFAMGCFWCGESDMEHTPGVIEAISGYTGGDLANPTYEQVSTETTGHFESVRVIYDPSKISYAKLLDVFWHNVDPFDAYGQFCDKGPSYLAAIFPVNAAQRKLAEASKAAVEKRFGRKTEVIIADMKPFYPAEGYHQDYYQKNPIRYRLYRGGCGRDSRLKEIWGDK